MRLPPWSRVAFCLFVIGWGANQFSPLLLVYRSQDHFSQTMVTAMFAAYVLGLVPALLAAAELAGRFGHRRVLRPVILLAGLSSVLLAVGHSSPSLLFVGRVLYGVCTGAAMSPGTTWIKELSDGAPSGTGARRAAIALSAGFGGGPLIAGLLAQWLPAPTLLPYLVHIALTALACALLWHAPVPARPHADRGLLAGLADLETQPPTPTHVAAGRHFWSRIAPMAPWVFTCASVSLVVLPALIRDHTAGFSVGFTGLLSGLTLGIGVLVQQPARAVEARSPGSVGVLGTAAAVIGVSLSALVVQDRSLPLVVVAGAVLGAGYGLNLVGGLTRVEQISPPAQLAMTNAVFYSLTYLGFFVPTVVSVLVRSWPESSVLLGLAALGVLTLGVALAVRRETVRAVHAAGSQATGR